MYDAIASKIKQIIEGIAGLGLRTVDYWGRSGLEGIGSQRGGLPAVLVMLGRSDPGIRLHDGTVRTEDLSFTIVVAAEDWQGFGAAQKGASDILEAIRDEFNPRVEVVNGRRVAFQFEGIENIAVEMPILVYALYLRAATL